MADYIIPESYSSKKDLLWINFEARNFDEQSGYGRGGYINTGDKISTWKFLAPTEMMENIAHEWGEYDSMGSRIGEKIGDLQQAFAEFRGLTNILNTRIESNKKEAGTGSGIAARQLVNKITSTAANVRIPKFKVDTATTYQNTKNREYEFVFELAVTPSSKSVRQAIYEPVRELEKLSCASFEEGTLVNIQFPAIFKIYTEPSDIIKINHAAVTAVQPTWKSPYKDGYPLHCDLQISVMDIEPLYRKSFEQGGIIQTS